MRLLRCSNNGVFSLTTNIVSEDEIPPYAILSHTWGADTEEVTFEDLANGAGKSKPGYQKIQFCGEQAQQDGLQYLWIDTCCINKANKAELSQAIRSMFRWYRNAARCYVYLPDVSHPSPKTDEEISPPLWESDFRKSRWFTRGWTLQELLAPSSVEFFSRERKKLGDKTSLTQQIYEITGIPHLALQGAPLSQFSVEERLLWKEHRHTKLKEDGAYSLLGIFDVYIAPIYGEGAEGAFRRLLEKIHKLEKCIQDIRLTDPRDDKQRIEGTKGGLLEGSYCWVLDNTNFQQWYNDPQSRLLWIKGDPGKGKTMLLCGIIEELKKSTPGLLSFFFCQGTDSRINSATAVLRGLIYLLVDQQPSLVSHVWKKYDQAGQSLFEDANAWVALSDIFTRMVQDLDIKTTYLVVDALDECVVDLPKLLSLITYTLSLSSSVKWLLSSRNEVHIEQKLRSADAQARLSLELKQNAEQVSRAVDVYIDDKLSRLESLEDDSLRDQVRDILRRKANGTFLWVALIVQELERPETWDPLQVVEEAPPGLHQLYDRMVDQIQQFSKRNSEICRLLLSTVSIAYRPLYLAEIGSLCGLSGQISVLARNVRKIVIMCGSFLTVRDDRVYLIHQSAKDYLSDEAQATVFPSKGKIHYDIFSQSLKLMTGILKRDIYGLVALGYPIDKVQAPVDDPLATTRYSCIHWVDHLHDSFSSKSTRCEESLQDGSVVYTFLKERYLYWLEGLSLCGSMSAGVISMAKLEALVQRTAHATTLMQLVQDARRFIMQHKGGIESSPLQVYASALLFSPTGSLVRKLFKHEEPRWITVKPATGNSWSACLQTLESHSSTVWSIAFSHDSTRLASASGDMTIKIWDASSGACLQTLKGHSDTVNSVAFSHDSTRLASASSDMTVKIWDASSGACLQTLEGQSSRVNSVAYSHDSTRVASALDDKTVKIWDASSGARLQTLKGHSNWVSLVAFSHDSTWLASASGDMTVKIWDASSGACLQMFEGYSSTVWSIAFSHDSTWLASASGDKTVKIWDTSSGACLRTLKGHSSRVNSVAFSHDSTGLASASDDKTVKIWDTSSGACLQTLESHSRTVWSIAFSHDSTRLASASGDMTVKIWDARSGARLQMLEGHSDTVNSVAFSHNLTWLASASRDKTVKIWDASSGACLQTLKGHSSIVWSTAFSHDSIRLASASDDETVKIWDASNGACLQTLKGHSSRVNSVAFSHDSTGLASASDDKTVKIWDASSGACLQTLESHSSTVWSIAFSHDSTRLASASGDKTVKIWDASSGACLQTLKGHSNWVSSVAFSHDSTWLASASSDMTVKIWDTSSGACLQTLSTGKTPWNLLFDSTSLCLYTETGYITTSRLTVSSATNMTEPQHPRYLGAGVSSDNTWITHNGKNILWVPSEARASCSSVAGKNVGIGVGSGKVWICSFNLDKSKDVGGIY